MPRLAPGDLAPAFTLPDADGRPVSSADLRGRRTVVYVYPAAMTPGCTTQACDFRDSLSALHAAGVAVVGLSPDPVAKLAKFRDKESLTFPLLSDPDHTVLEAFGAWGEKKLYGKTDGRGDPLDVRARRRGAHRAGDVRRQGDRPRRPAAPRLGVD